MCKIQEPQFSYESKTYWIVFKLIQARKDIFKMKTVQNVPFYQKVKPLLSIIANFIYQLLCATEPSVWSNTSLNVAAKAFFFFQMWLTFKSMNFGQSRWTPMMWVGLVQSAEILKREDWGRLKKKEFCLQMAFRLHCLPFKLAHKHMNQFLKID